LQAATADEWLAGANDYFDGGAEQVPALQAWPVDRLVNNARNQGAELIDVAGEILS
jgi:putative SOS response-associated peptidase YedK